MNTPSQEEIEEMNIVMTLICNAIGPHLAQAIAEGVREALLEVDKINQHSASAAQGELKPVMQGIPHHETLEKMLWCNVYSHAVGNDATRDMRTWYANNAVEEYNKRFPQ